MGVTSTSKQVNLERIDCDGTLQVTLALSASPDIVSNPTDIVLTLDRSDSLEGAPMESVKAGAKTFIDILSESTGGAPDAIGSGSRIGIVSFNQAATSDTQLITSVAARKDAADALDASGSTNHAAAFSAAMQLFDPQSANAKVIVLFTDGKTTAGPPPAPIAAAARAEGIILYCIGLIGSDGIDVSVLNDWATDPDASHVAVTPDAADPEDLFRDLAANISKTGATDIVIDEVVSADFQFAVFDAGDVRLESLGRILELNFTVKRVCPGKRVALGVLLSEVGENGDEYPRGMKALTLPAHNAPSCRDIRVKCVRFVLPEDLSAVEEEPGCMCRERSFRVRTIAHPVDYGFHCCEADPT